MKVNVECQSLNINPALTLAENGLISLLSMHNNKGVNSFDSVFGANDPHQIAEVLKQLVKKNVFNIKETNEHDSLVINIINGDTKSTSKLVNISKNKQIQLCFQLNDTKLKSITERSSDKKSFKHNLITVCFDNYTYRKLPITEVNSEQDFLDLMYAITPFETIVMHDKRLTRKDFDQVFDMINTYDFDLALFNFAIDYAISTSTYYNLSYEFVEILLNNLKKHNITDVKAAIELIKLQKEASSKKGSRYVAPVYDAPEETNQVQSIIDVKNLFTEDSDFE
ncbi:DnaD domain protein [Mollicutes bacterium LVI A0078]|nr:DnaD domain protein [Mollicutes bacterium LVI A0075]WOO91099.1 DnaD domain protein [Mollicutes bacterium LVI A0078]